MTRSGRQFHPDAIAEGIARLEVVADDLERSAGRFEAEAQRGKAFGIGQDEREPAQARSACGRQVALGPDQMLKARVWGM